MDQRLNHRYEKPDQRVDEYQENTHGKSRSPRQLKRFSHAEITPKCDEEVARYMCQGLNSHFFHIIGYGHQPNSRGLYTHYKDSYFSGGIFPIPKKSRLLTMAHMKVEFRDFVFEGLSLNFWCIHGDCISAGQISSRPHTTDFPQR